MKLLAILSITILLFTNCSRNIIQRQVLRDVQELSSDKYKGRKVGTAGNALAADYIISRFKEIGLQAFEGSFNHSFSFSERSGAPIAGSNLIAYIPGKKQDAIVISAHYDHLGVIEGEIYNGADDNASGVGGLLSIAEYFSKNPPEHTLVFAAFDAEESGLQGAKAFVANPPLQFECIKLNVNMDMISRSEKNELYAVGTFHYPLLKAHVTTTNPDIKILFGHDEPATGKDDWTNLSDQAAFHAKKIPFLYFGVEDHADYHKPTDDFKNIDKEFYQNAVGAILEVVKNIDRSVTIQKIFRDKLIMK